MGPHGTVPRPVLDAIFPASLKWRARNVVLRERASDTDTRNNYGHRRQPLRRRVHSRPPVVAKLSRRRGQLACRAVRDRLGEPAGREYNTLLIALHPMAAISLPIPRAGSPLVAV